VNIITEKLLENVDKNLIDNIVTGQKGIPESIYIRLPILQDQLLAIVAVQNAQILQNQKRQEYSQCLRDGIKI